MKGKSKAEAYKYMQDIALKYAEKQVLTQKKLNFSEVLKYDISTYSEDEIKVEVMFCTA
jgi:hypothetical protein